MSVTRAMLLCEPDYADVHTELLSRFANGIASTEPGQCFERRVKLGKIRHWIAYNPHDVRTMTTRGQLLEPRSGYVEDKKGEAVAVFGENGGTTLHGTDARAIEVTDLLKGA